MISTKNVIELQQDSIVAILKRFKNLVIRVSIPSYSTEFAKSIEPHVPAPVDRIRVLNYLAQEHFYTIVRLQPLFPERVNEATKDLIPRLGEAKTKHVVVEFLKLPLEGKTGHTSYLFTRLNWSRNNVYHSDHAIRAGREWVLKPEYKWELLQPVIESIHASGMTYGAGDYGLNHLGDTDCCCGIDEVDGFAQWFKPNLAHIIRRSKSSRLDVSLLDEFTSSKKSIRMYLNSHCRGRDENTLYDFLKLKWNRPGTENAPDTFLGVSFRGEYDDSSNCIYIRELL